MSDLLFSAELDGNKFRDGLDRLRAVVREKHAEMVRDWANEQDKWGEVERVRDDRRAKFVTASLNQGLDAMKRSAREGHGAMREEYGLTEERHSHFIKHLGKHLIADAMGIREAIKQLREYAAETGVGTDQVESLSMAMKEFRNSIGRDITSGGAGGLFSSIIHGASAAREVLADMLALVYRPLLGPSGERGPANVFKAEQAAKDLEAVSKEYKAYSEHVEMANRQLAEQKKLVGDTFLAEKLLARERYENRVRSINGMEGLSGSQKSDLVAGSRRIMDLEIAKAVEAHEERTNRFLNEAGKLRGERLRDELAAAETRRESRDRHAEEVGRQREAFRIDLERMKLDEIRAKGNDREIRAAQLQLDLKEKLRRVEESDLPEYEKAIYRRRISESVGRQMDLLDFEKPQRKERLRDDIVGMLDPGAGGGTRGSIVGQIFGGQVARRADEQLTETRTQTGLLREILASLAAEVATYAP